MRTARTDEDTEDWLIKKQRKWLLKQATPSASSECLFAREAQPEVPHVFRGMRDSDCSHVHRERDRDGDRKKDESKREEIDKIDKIDSTGKTNKANKTDKIHNIDQTG